MMGHPVWTAAGAVVLVVLVLIGVFIVRLRRLAGRVGSFECALRRPGLNRWMSGIATFGGDSVEWTRLVSLSVRPRYRFERADIELGGVSHRGAEGNIVDVECAYRGERFDLAMVEDSHSAMVAWLESAAPTQPKLL